MLAPYAADILKGLGTVVQNFNVEEFKKAKAANPKMMNSHMILCEDAVLAIGSFAVAVGQEFSVVNSFSAFISRDCDFPGFKSFPNRSTFTSNDFTTFFSILSFSFKVFKKITIFRRPPVPNFDPSFKSDHLELPYSVFSTYLMKSRKYRNQKSLHL